MLKQPALRQIGVGETLDERDPGDTVDRHDRHSALP